MTYLFVCTGNTCRSPMAEAICRLRIGRGDAVFSAGLAADGSPISDNAVSVLREIGISADGRRSVQLTKDLCDKADRIFVMNAGHRDFLAENGVEPDKIAVLGSGIPDPYGGNVENYRAVRDAIFEAICRQIPPFPASSVTVRPLSAAFVKNVAAIEAICFDDNWSFTAIDEELKNKTAYLTVAMTELGTIAGYVIAHKVVDEVFLERIACLPVYRQSGIATKLMADLKAFAAASGASRITLEVRTSNTPAKRFYQKEGFVFEGKRPGFYEHPREDAEIYSYYGEGESK